MLVGIPREVKDNEYRVAATPEGVRELVHAGHEVLVEAGAGDGSALRDEDFVAAGVDPGARAEQLDVEAWGRLVLAVRARSGGGT